MTLGEFKTRLKMLIDETQSDSELQSKLNFFIDKAQKEVAFVDKIIRQYKIVQNNSSVKQLLPNESELFKTKPYYPDNKPIPLQAERACAYSFAVDDVAVVRIEIDNGAGWELFKSISNPQEPHSKDGDGFTYYKGLLPSFCSVKIIFDGDTFYSYKDTAIFGVPFSSESRIPHFKSFSEYKLPLDFNELESITLSTEPVSNYRIAGRKLVMLEYCADGEFNIQYSAFPKTISDFEDDTYELELSTEGQEAAVYLAAWLALVADESATTKNDFLSKYNNAMVNISNKQSMANVCCIESYSEVL